MKSKLVAIGAVFVPIAVLIIVGIVAFSVRPKRVMRSEANTIAKESSAESQTGLKTSSSPPISSRNTSGDKLYVLDGTGLDAFMIGDDDKTGVDPEVMHIYSTEVDDFLKIGSLNADREQFLSTKGIVLTKPNRKWHITILEAGVVDGDTRAHVHCNVGVGTMLNGGIGMAVEHGVDEIWKLDLTGTKPILIERATMYHNGVATHAESPPFVIPPGSGSNVLITN